jgi:hypothetical protein
MDSVSTYVDGMRTLAPPATAEEPPPFRRAGSRVTRGLLRCGIVAGPLFVLAFLVEGATRAHYDPLRHPVSSLALGASGWTQIVNFVVAGLLTLAFAVGLRRVLRDGTRGSVWGPRLIGIWAVHLIVAGVFVTDPVSGYPPGTPDRLSEYGSAHAAIHDLVSVVGFAALALAPAVFAVRFAVRRERAWAGYSALTAVVILVVFALATAGFSQAAGLVDIAGLLQRVTVTAGWCWLTLLARHTGREIA